jgi:Mn2+/Fe2+ NRAMP family transporter
MKRLIQIALGIVTSVGGFLEIGSITTAAQAGAGFGYQLLWAVVLGTLCITFLVEMSGRFSAVSKQTIPDAMRERFGANFFAITLIILLLVSLLVLAAEIGGVGAALEMATGGRCPLGRFRSRFSRGPCSGARHSASSRMACRCSDS